MNMTCLVVGHRYYFDDVRGEYCPRCYKRFPYVPNKPPVMPAGERLERLAVGVIIGTAAMLALHLVA